jgi:DNA repair photolyase
VPVRAVPASRALTPNACASAPFRWTLNPYRGCAHGCVYCFARRFHDDPGEGFARDVVAKTGVGEVLRRELARPSWRREHVAVGTSADPYQPAEKRLRLLPAVWEALRDHATPCSVLTRSPLVLRDAALLRAAGAGVCFSVPTLDEDVWRATEPHTPHPIARLAAVAQLGRLGVPAGVVVAPLMPGVNDAPAEVERVLAAARDAGAVHVGGAALHLPGEVRALVLAWVRERRPDLLETYGRLYDGRTYLRAADRRRVEAGLASVAPCDGGFLATPAERPAVPQAALF